jgi:hypothetical protein
VPLTGIVDLVLAAGFVLAALALTGAAVGFLSRRALVLLTCVELGAAVTVWLLFALRHSHERELAVAAVGLTVCAVVGASSVLLERARRRIAATNARFEEAQETLRTVVDREAKDRAAELERTLARARADSVSLLEAEERRIADDRRREFVQREREYASTLTESLTATQSQVEHRLAAWAQDLDRAAEVSKARIAELGQRQKQLLSEVELRLAADADRLAAESEEQRAAVQRMRGELERALEETLVAASAEVDAHAVERRRALHELEERMRQRERELAERIEREEGDVAGRIRASFADVERRQVEQLERVVQRAAATYSDEAALQFAAIIKGSREDAARRLSRELERAVEVFAREAESVLAERLAHVGDAGAQRLERRLADATAAIEDRRSEQLAAVDMRIAELEADIRRRLEELASDTDAERAVIEARLQELMRRLDAAGALRST